VRSLLACRHGCLGALAQRLVSGEAAISLDAPCACMYQGEKEEAWQWLPSSACCMRAELIRA
jgi:hypothetical protein